MSEESKPHSDLGNVILDGIYASDDDNAREDAAQVAVARLEDQLEAEKKWGRNQADLLTECATENERLLEQLEEAREDATEGLAAAVKLVRLEEQYKHLENELDDMTGQFCNEAIHLTRAEDRVRELEEQFDALREAAAAYLEHTEDQHFRRGHFNTSCPPLTRAMCTEYMQLRAVLYPAKEPS